MANEYQDGPKRRVKIRLFVDEKKELHHEFVDQDIRELFNRVDARDFFEVLRPIQREAEKNKDRKTNRTDLKVGDRVRTDNYKGELRDIHPGIHLRFNGQDEICWFSNDQMNFVIDVGPDPELDRLRKPLTHNTDLTNEQLLSENDPTNNPFENKFPMICVNGTEACSGPLKTGDDVKAQRYFKYTVTVLGTDITLDPHIDGHDG